MFHVVFANKMPCRSSRHDNAYKQRGTKARRTRLYLEEIQTDLMQMSTDAGGDQISQVMGLPEHHHFVLGRL